ncbi:MAG: hypothetical protein K2Z81_23645, partial [Cyanobacteria bacterium]|nr:hypothetical protein [Cyanobacteriota bacterium]
EPETIRSLTKRRSERHDPIAGMPVGSFPRAEFGLPIVFHFQDPDRSEPLDTILQPNVNGQSFDRMSSPLIVKPLAMGKDKAVPLILLLQTIPLEQVELIEKKENGQQWSCRNLRGEDLESYNNSPLTGTASGSALDGFIQFAITHGGFREEYSI